MLRGRFLAQIRPCHRLCTKRVRSFTSGTSFPDPTRPDIFYHLINPPNPRSKHHPAFAISFLSSPPPSPDSRTILGWLHAATAAESDSGAGLNDFLENSAFLQVILGLRFLLWGVLRCVTEPFIDILHYAIKQALVEGIDEVQIARAVQTQQGWMHINGA